VVAWLFVGCAPNRHVWLQSHARTALDVCALMPVCLCFADGLFDIMSSSFGVVDLHLERAKAGTRRS
jgi:hypothetical protein